MIRGTLLGRLQIQKTPVSRGLGRCAREDFRSCTLETGSAGPVGGENFRDPRRLDQNCAELTESEKPLPDTHPSVPGHACVTLEKSESLGCTGLVTLVRLESALPAFPGEENFFLLPASGRLLYENEKRGERGCPRLSAVIRGYPRLRSLPSFGVLRFHPRHPWLKLLTSLPSWTSVK